MDGIEIEKFGITTHFDLCEALLDVLREWLGSKAGLVDVECAWPSICVHDSLPSLRAAMRDLLEQAWRLAAGDLTSIEASACVRSGLSDWTLRIAGVCADMDMKRLQAAAKRLGMEFDCAGSGRRLVRAYGQCMQTGGRLELVGVPRRGFILWFRDVMGLHLPAPDSRVSGHLRVRIPRKGVSIPAERSSTSGAETPAIRRPPWTDVAWLMPPTQIVDASARTALTEWTTSA